MLNCQATNYSEQKLVFSSNFFSLIQDLFYEEIKYFGKNNQSEDLKKNGQQILHILHYIIYHRYIVATLAINQPTNMSVSLSTLKCFFSPSTYRLPEQILPISIWLCKHTGLA